MKMEKESLKSKAPLYKDNGAVHASFRTFDIPDLIEKMKHSNAWAKGELNAMILLKSPEKQIVLTTLHEGTEINSFQSNVSITFQIIEGKLRFHTRKKSVTVDKGHLLTVREKVKYSLTTGEETVFLITIANDNLQAVEL